MIVLGIETSCDETAAALVDSDRTILGQRLLSQLDQHAPFGGVVPEIAARVHLEHIDRLISQVLDDCKLNISELDGVAATAGPGLIGGVLVGAMTAKSMALVHDRPFVAVNHLEAHALTARLSNNVVFPYLLLLVSGGHCQLLSVEGVGTYHRLGTTIDDALGEAFDKVGKMLGLGYPGGPAVERAAQKGDPTRFPLPRPLKGKPGCDFSFSGLKTAVRQTVDRLPPGKLDNQDVADLCASFQAAAGDVLVDRCRHALSLFRDQTGSDGPLVVAGGVAANKYIRQHLEILEIPVIAPPLALCTDNAAMVAWAGLERLRLGQSDGLDFRPRPRWPLDPDAPVAVGAGVKA
ncbi:tRNA (adenosine(37)-N6)-threonylcarbamoyltransferase complex transferase subunit TsaD [Magnetospira sp. QH-2]|uniref:tRNA (adenosine(37)-N6)-threonylcarbamoyltransferase complex transferase subunit TsaD n=1 Tax=Magnetospira sp. (strain QH-2) TaxID=1288970 RepID=UPI0003E81521|nr:tRNA (adenosine(37)-N6)-threonylcarbamoyltransferase complex transferase subunit TsaD [Magnetospira sp. QH-2]CCQ75377.1 putative O-sialoglycoprotein endopeptidase [Magnetospira sp. QH-2]